MFNINWDTGIDPSCIQKFIVRESNVAVILCIDHCCVPTNIETSEYIIMPYLIIGDEAFCIEWTLGQALIDCYSVYCCYVYIRIRYIDVSSFLSHNNLLSKLEDTVVSRDPFIRWVIWKKECILSCIFEGGFKESNVLGGDITIINYEFAFVTCENRCWKHPFCNGCIIVIGRGPHLCIGFERRIEAGPRAIVPFVMNDNISQIPSNINIRFICVRSIIK